MEITEVRIKLIEDPGERLKAFCSVTFDNCFVVRDLKIIEGGSGPFVAMPSRKLTAHCPRCSTKNHLRAQHCNQCGGTLSNDRMPVDQDGRTKLYADIAHPINSTCREMIQERVVHEFQDEIERAKKPDYVSRYDDFDIGPDEPTSSTARTSETRIDQAHVQRSAHTPSPGSAGEQVRPQDRAPVPSPKTISNDPPAPKGGFGAGILPKN